MSLDAAAQARENGRSRRRELITTWPSWRDAGRETAPRPRARARIVVEKYAYRNVTLLMTHYDTKEQLSLLWDKVRGRLSNTQEDSPTRLRTARYTIACVAVGTPLQVSTKRAQALIERGGVLPKRCVADVGHEMDLGVGEASLVLIHDLWLHNRILRAVRDQHGFADPRQDIVVGEGPAEQALADVRRD